MKFLLLSCVVIGAFAEPPRFRQERFRFQRQELAPTSADSPREPTTEASGPYPASGWKPAGEEFTLPNKQPEKPADQYGAPDSGSGWKSQGPVFELPATSYGVPNATYGVPDSTAVPTTDNPQAESLEGQTEVQKNVGSYFVLLPGGLLQKVEVVTENDVQNSKSARLQLRKPAARLVFRP